MPNVLIRDTQSLISTRRVIQKEPPLLPPPKQPPLTDTRDAHNLVVSFRGSHHFEGADAVVVVQLSGHGDGEKGAEEEEEGVDGEEVGVDGVGLGVHGYGCR